MTRIDSAFKGLQRRCGLLGERSSEISEIIDLIDEIAAQTNLLALQRRNRGSPCRRGRLGFSVGLRRSESSPRGLRVPPRCWNLIKAIQNETSEALTAMEKGMEEVKGGSSLARRRKSLQSSPRPFDINRAESKRSLRQARSRRG